MLGSIYNRFILYKTGWNKSIYLQNDGQSITRAGSTDSVCNILYMLTPADADSLFLPVVELLWSSPGIHFSFTLLLLCSDKTKYSGASGTSENHHNNMALENHRHINLAAKKRPREQMFNQIIPSARGCGTSCTAAWDCHRFFST